MAIGGTYGAGTHTIDVSPAERIQIDHRGVAGSQGENAFGDAGQPGAGGNAGQLTGELDVSNVSTLTVYNADGRTVANWTVGDGGQGGAGGEDTDGNTAGDGGDGGAASKIELDGTVTAIVDGGGGGGGAGTVSGSNASLGGGGGGGGGQGGVGAAGGTASNDAGTAGGDGDGTGNGGDGGAGGDATSTGGGEDGSDGTVGGVQLTDGGAFATSTETVGGSTRDTAEIELTVTELTADPPANLSATGVSPSEIELSWDGDANADSYNIYRSETAGVSTSGTAHASVTHPTTSYTDGGLLEGREYYYAVTAVVDGNETDSSNEDAGASVLPAPTDLAIAGVDNDGGSLSWTLQSTDEAGVLVETRLGGASQWTEQADLAAGTESYALAGLLNGRDYEARVAAYTSDVTEYDQ